MTEISGLLKSDHVGVEWGAGRSTAWVAQRVAFVTSIEEDPTWADRVKQLTQNLPVELLCLAGKEYVLAGTRLGQIDFAIVDGAFRDECTLAVLSFIKPGGILIIDDSHRYFGPSLLPFGVRDPQSNAWQQVARQLRGWRQNRYTDGVTETAIFARPE